MAYIAVLFYGFPLVLLALWLTPFVCRCAGIRAVNDDPDAVPQTPQAT